MDKSIVPSTAPNAQWRGSMCGLVLHLRLQPSIVFEFSIVSVLHCISAGFFCPNFAKAPSTSTCDKRIRAPKPLYISGIVRADSTLEPKFMSRRVTVTSRFARKSGHIGPKASSTQVRSLQRTRFVHNNVKISRDLDRLTKPPRKTCTWVVGR